MQFIFKNYRVVKDIQADLQADQEKAQAALKIDMDAIKKLQDRLPELPPRDSSEYEDLDKQIVNAQADLSVKRTIILKELQHQEAKKLSQGLSADPGRGRRLRQRQRHHGGAAIQPRDDRPGEARDRPGGARAIRSSGTKNLDISKYILQNLERRAGPAVGRANPAFPAGPGGVQALKRPGGRAATDGRRRPRERIIPSFGHG